MTIVKNVQGRGKPVRAASSRRSPMHARTMSSRMLLIFFMQLPTFALADEGGISLWLPGQFGSLAAAPQRPGWSFANIYYHTSVSAGGDVAAARQFTTRAFTRTAAVNLNANLNAHADLDFVSVNRVFETPVLGGQLAVGVTSAAGYNSTSINGTLTASIGNLTATRTGSTSDARGGVADLYPLASLRWNSGVNNYMVYMLGDIPVGTYDPTRLANFGIGHGAIDGGVGYTYLDPQTGHEFSVVTGLTGNFANPDTQYQNGMDWHLDWGASQFLTKQWHIGAVGYVYKQINPDSGAPEHIGRQSITGVWNRPTGRVLVSNWRQARISEFEGLPGIRPRAQSGRMEFVADVCNKSLMPAAAEYEAGRS